MFDEEACTTWVAKVSKPAEWLRAVAWEKSFTPRKDPHLMTFSEIQKAIANTLCPPSLFESCGVAVAYCQSNSWQWGLEDFCLVVFFSSRPVTLEQITSDIFPTLQGVDIEPAYGSTESLRRLLETGGRRGEAIGRVYRQGLPIRVN